MYKKHEACLLGKGSLDFNLLGHQGHKGQKLDCYWLGSLDFNLLVEIKLGCPLNRARRVKLFAGGKSKAKLPGKDVWAEKDGQCERFGNKSCSDILMGGTGCFLTGESHFTFSVQLFPLSSCVHSK